MRHLSDARVGNALPCKCCMPVPFAPVAKCPKYSFEALLCLQLSRLWVLELWKMEQRTIPGAMGSTWALQHTQRRPRVNLTVWPEHARAQLATGT